MPESHRLFLTPRLSYKDNVDDFGFPGERGGGFFLPISW